MVLLTSNIRLVILKTLHLDIFAKIPVYKITKASTMNHTNYEIHSKNKAVNKGIAFRTKCRRK